MKKTRNNAIRCVTFDLDDTLWAIHPIIARAENALHAWMKKHLPRIAESCSPQDLSTHRQEYFVLHPELHHDLTQLRKNWMMELMRRYEYSTDKLEQGFHVFWKERNSVDLFENVHEVLDLVSENFRAGAITNGNADLSEIGIDQYFDFHLTSSEVGVSKPHPDIFKAALDDTGLEPQQTVHVGDDPDADVRGAAGVGMRTIWVNPERAQWSGENEPDGIIHSIRELPDALTALQPPRFS